MGRLEDIIERNRNPKANRERIVVGIGLGVFLLVIISLMVFTDLGKSPEPKRSSPPASGDHHVDDVPLKSPRSK